MNFHRIIIAFCGLALAEANAIDQSFQSCSHKIGDSIFCINLTRPLSTREFAQDGVQSETEFIYGTLDSGTVKVFNEIFGAIEKLRPYHQKNTLLVDLLKAEIENVYDRLIVENVGTTLNLSGGYLIAAAFSKIMQNTPNVKKDLTVIADQLKNVGVIMFDNGKIEFDLENAVSSAVSCCGFTLRRK